MSTTQGVATVRYKSWRVNGKFRNGEGISIEDHRVEPGGLIGLRDRGGKSSSLVVVLDPRRRDYRIKLWLNDEHVGNKFMFCGGSDDSIVCVTLPHVNNGFHTGSVARSDVEKMAGFGSAGSRSRLNIPYMDAEDVCYVARFTPETSQSWSKLRANTSELSEWLDGDNAELTITPERTGGGHHSLFLRLSDKANDRMMRRQLVWHRVNGIWVHWVPIAGDERLKNCWMGMCLPEDMDTIRDWGEDGTVVDLPDEPLRPRTRLWLRKLDRETGPISYDSYRAWDRSITTMKSRLWSLCGCRGQIDVYESLVRRYDTRRNHLLALVDKRYRDRGNGEDRDQWISGERYARKWSDEAARLDKAVSSRRETLESLRKSYAKLHVEYLEALSNVEMYEGVYASEIEDMIEG